MVKFKDNFSKQSDAYLKYRPTYPDALFEFLAKEVKERDLVWDCGTGNGQAALSLSKYFKKVYATDASTKQIENAVQHTGIEYHVEPAEKVGLTDSSADLVTAAIALHWFDLNLFYKEVRRVLKPHGIIAAWTYRLPTISREVDAVVRRFHDEVVDEYWQRENRLVEEGYKTIPFPFEEIKAPVFTMQKKWNLDNLIGLVSSWSAVQRIIQQTGANPIPGLEEELTQVWGDKKSKKWASWKLILKVGKVEPS